MLLTTMANTSIPYHSILYMHYPIQYHYYTMSLKARNVYTVWIYICSAEAMFVHRCGVYAQALAMRHSTAMRARLPSQIASMIPQWVYASPTSLQDPHVLLDMVRTHARIHVLGSQLLSSSTFLGDGWPLPGLPASSCSALSKLPVQC